MIIIMGSVTGTPETVDGLLVASLEHVGRSREEPGCISHAVHRDAENPLRLVFFERWESAEAVRAYFAVPASAQFVRTAAALAASPPSLELFTATPASLQAL
jgi:quinol monooxygenase YgiN